MDLQKPGDSFGGKKENMEGGRGALVPLKGGPRADTNVGLAQMIRKGCKTHSLQSTFWHMQ